MWWILHHILDWIQWKATSLHQKGKFCLLLQPSNCSIQRSDGTDGMKKKANSSHKRPLHRPCNFLTIECVTVMHKYRYVTLCSGKNAKPKFIPTANKQKQMNIYWSWYSVISIARRTWIWWSKVGLSLSNWKTNL